MSSPITNIVVLMLENRSFDNLLGWLYDSQNNPPFNKVPPNQTFEGLDNNPAPNVWQGKSYPPVHGTDMTQPNPDPNELYANMYMQMFNPDPFVIPNPIPDGPGLTAAATMTGYMNDYATAKDVDSAQVPNIMNCFRPADVPVISALANAYAVCDHWYSSVPSQTYTNRSFVHAGTASGYVNNVIGAHFWDTFTNNTTTIYNLLQNANISWGIYYGGDEFLCQARNNQLKLSPYKDTNFFPFSQFLTDAKNGTLPSYVFVEPNFLASFIHLLPENDEHPQAAPTQLHGPSNVLFGEQLLANVFNALTAGPQWYTPGKAATLFIVIFDEGGGTYDHFPVDAATAKAITPDGVTIPSGQPGYSGFNFDRYGARVPAVICSPYVAGATVCNTLFDHTSVLSTAIQVFLESKVSPNALGARTAAANNLMPLISSSAVNTTLPTLHPRTPPDFDIASLADAPLTDFQKELVGSAIKFAQKHTPIAAAALGTPTVETHADAWRIAAALDKAKE